MGLIFAYAKLDHIQFDKHKSIERLSLKCIQLSLHCSQVEIFLFENICQSDCLYARTEPVIKNLISLAFKSICNLHHTRGITPKRVSSGGVHLRDLAPGQHSSEETSLRWESMANYLQFNRPGNRTLDFPSR